MELALMGNHANVAMEYCYRDAGNNKLWNTVVFRNSKGLDLSKLEIEITALLIDGLWFVPKNIEVPTLRFDKDELELDHDWHEFHGLSETSSDVVADGARDIEDVMKSFLKGALLEQRK